MRYAEAFYNGISASDPYAAMTARIKAELAAIAIEISRMLPNRIGICWHDRTIVVHNAMGRWLGIARMEITPSDTRWPVCVAWHGEMLFAHTMGGLCEVFERMLADSSVARVIAFAAAIPGAKLSSDEVDLAEKSIEHPELFKS